MKEKARKRAKARERERTKARNFKRKLQPAK